MLASARWNAHVNCDIYPILILQFFSRVANIVHLDWSSTLSSPVRLRGRQRGWAVISWGWDHHRDERADRRWQLDGGRVGTSTRTTGNVSDQLRAHVAGLTFGKPQLVNECHEHCQFDECRQSWPKKLAKEAEGMNQHDAFKQSSIVSSELYYHERSEKWTLGIDEHRY